jgi:hypothetical protein
METKTLTMEHNAAVNTRWRKSAIIAIAGASLSLSVMSAGRRPRAAKKADPWGNL